MKKSNFKPEQDNTISPSGKHIYKESWKKIDIKQPTKLSEIKDFNELNMSIY